jgi:hypothetical protein
VEGTVCIFDTGSFCMDTNVCNHDYVASPVDATAPVVFETREACRAFTKQGEPTMVINAPCVTGRCCHDLMDCVDGITEAECQALPGSTAFSLGDVCTGDPRADCPTCFDYDLHHNGPVVTQSCSGSGGADVSAVQTSLGLAAMGFDMSQVANARLADDFVIADPDGWHIDTITVLGFQAGSTTTSTFTGATLRIWDGIPGDPGSSVVFGDTTTDRLIDCAWTGIYRAPESSPLNTDRPVMACAIAVDTILGPGTYWAGWAASGTLGDGPNAVPVTIPGQTTTGNARFFDGLDWQDVLDPGVAAPQGLAFAVQGARRDCGCARVAPVKTDGTSPAGTCGLQKVRYLTLLGDAPGKQTAMRVTLRDLPAPYDSLNGQTLWVGQPEVICENSGQTTPPPEGCGVSGVPPPTILAATLRASPPYYTDWTLLGAVNVYHEYLVPGGTYDIQAIGEGCDTGDEAAYAAPLVLTTSIWGDTVGNCTVYPCSPPDGIVNVTTDVTAILDKFKNLPAAPLKTRCDIEPATPDQLVNITDVAQSIDAFLGLGYPFGPPE